VNFLKVQWKLIAILSAGFVGHGALTQADEAGTFPRTAVGR
jgi:hypothetical protein